MGFLENTFDILIVGGGAAGLAAAVFAGRRRVKVAIIEKQPSLGRKLLSTGGGHCNITNNASKEEFYSAFGRNGRFLAPALENFDNEKMKDFFLSLGVPLYSPDNFHIFPRSGKAVDILDLMLKECKKNDVAIFSSCRAEKLLISDGIIRGVKTNLGDFFAKKLILACGGMSYPQFGSNGDGYNLAKFAGHSIVSPVPALVELFSSEKYFAKLAGVSLKDVIVSIPATKNPPERGELLFTHRGFSGPSILNISGEVSEIISKNGSANICVNFYPKFSEKEWTAKFAEWRNSSGNAKIANLLSAFLPKSLSECLCGISFANFAKASQINTETQNMLIKNISSAILEINGTAGFNKAMLTKGGVSIREINPKTLESKIIKGLFFAGEILDLQGPCGGYNLQWAFSSGILAQASPNPI